MSTDTLFVNSGYGDPVKNPKLRVSDNNPYIGYYGYVRNEGDRNHSGFDYEATQGTPVLSTFPTQNLSVELWIGRPQYYCELRNYPINKHFSYEICKNCNVIDKDKCYGVRLYLIDNERKIKIIYAHLSQINKTIINILKEKEYKEKKISCKYHKGTTLIIKGQEIALSGNTGNAYTMIDNNKSNKTEQQHLHFECIFNINTKVNPNNYVRTQFKLKRVAKDSSDVAENEILLDYLKNVQQIEWKDFWARRNFEQKIAGLDRYRIIGEVDDVTSFSHYC